MTTSNADHIKIPGVYASDIDIDNIEIPGVDVDIQEPQVIEIIDPDISPTDPDPNEGRHFDWAQWKPVGRLQIYGSQHRKENC